MIPLAGTCRLGSVPAPNQRHHFAHANQTRKAGFPAPRVACLFSLHKTDSWSTQVASVPLYVRAPPRNHPVVPSRLWPPYAPIHPIWQATRRFSKGADIDSRPPRPERHRRRGSSEACGLETDWCKNLCSDLAHSQAFAVIPWSISRPKRTQSCAVTCPAALARLPTIRRIYR
jgi:hypothetical protein